MQIQYSSPTLFAKNEDIDWSQAMNYVKAAEQQFPIAQKDLTEIMSKPGVKPTYNFASIVNHSPTLQRYMDYKSLNSNGTFLIMIASEMSNVFRKLKAKILGIKIVYFKRKVCF